jgi:hypothetical protein
MILRRMAANLRAQNWTGVAIELAIVIVGVFIGIQAANWNQQRQERNETRTLLSQLQTELRLFGGFLDRLDDYYVTTRKYANTAAAGWQSDPSVSDEEFVIAAYQASQVTAAGNNAAVWAEIFGAADLRNIENLEVRGNLARVMTFDYELIDLRSVSTPYREQVRKVIPDDLQDSIRTHCGDRPLADSFGFELPPTCSIDLPDQEAAKTAAALRARPGLAEELRWHQAAVANQMLNVESLKRMVRDLMNGIEGP